MDALITRPSLLSAAKNFIRKSAGTAVLVIAPLAAVSMVNEAKAQAVFGPGSFSGQSFSNGAANDSGSFFSVSLPQVGDITGYRVGVNENFQFLSGFGSSVSGHALVYIGSSTFTGTITNGTNIPVAYDFNLTGIGSVQVQQWTVYLNISSDPATLVGTGSGFGNFIGTSTYTTGADYTNGYANLYMDISYINANGINGDSLSLTMNSSSQGISINTSAIPEPSVYAAVLGLGALGFVMLRRSRRAAA